MAQEAIIAKGLKIIQWEEKENRKSDLNHISAKLIKKTEIKACLNIKIKGLIINRSIIGRLRQP